MSNLIVMKRGFSNQVYLGNHNLPPRTSRIQDSQPMPQAGLDFSLKEQMFTGRNMQTFADKYLFQKPGSCLGTKITSYSEHRDQKHFDTPFWCSRLLHYVCPCVHLVSSPFRGRGAVSLPSGAYKLWYQQSVRRGTNYDRASQLACWNFRRAQ